LNDKPAAAEEEDDDDDNNGDGMPLLFWSSRPCSAINVCIVVTVSSVSFLLLRPPSPPPRNSAGPIAIERVTEGMNGRNDRAAGGIHGQSMSSYGRSFCCEVVGLCTEPINFDREGFIFLFFFFFFLISTTPRG
jgi:hypothetical protein